MLLDEFEESKDVEPGIRSPLEVEHAGGTVLIGRANEMCGPLHVGRDASQAGILELLDDSLSIPRVESEALDFSAEDFA